MGGEGRERGGKEHREEGWQRAIKKACAVIVWATST